MLTTILSWLAFLMPVVTWIMGKLKLSKETQEAFIAKVQAAKDDGLVSIQGRDEFRRQDEEILKPIKEEIKDDGK
jgi:hypothetical protein